MPGTGIESFNSFQDNCLHAVPSRGFEPLIREEYAPKAYAYTVPPRGPNTYYIRLILNIEELTIIFRKKKGGTRRYPPNIYPNAKITFPWPSLGI